MIEIKKVSKTFNNEKKAIDNISLKLEDGEIIGFIGLNGAGKTTLIKMMTGVLKPDSGTIKINGFDILKQPIEAKQIIGYMADSPDMFLRLTGIEYINLLADIYKVPLEIRKERINNLCSQFHLNEVLNQPMQGYSHGTRQKMMVVGALVHEPKVWILDEPLIGLDPQSSIILKIAEKLCDKVAIIDRGKIVYYGTLEDLKKQYKKKDLENLFMEVVGNE